MIYLLIYLFVFIKFITITNILVQAQEVVLDLQNIHEDRSSFTVINKFGPIQITSYIPSIEHNVVGVKDKNKVIWSHDTENDQIYNVKVYTKYNKNCLVYLYIINTESSNSRYYVNTDNKWEEVLLFDFEYYMNKFEKERILDLKNLFDDGTCFVDTHRFGGIPATIYIPKEKYHLIAVMNGPDPIWIREADFDRCTSVILHGSPDEPKLININLKLSGNFEQKFYNFEDGSWKEITKTHFYQTLEVLDNEANEGENQQTEQTE